jgi:hypothetical protein
MQTKAKSNSIITHALEGANIRFFFRGESIGLLQPDMVSPSNRARAMLHGFVQRVGDGGAVEMRAPDGTLRTKDEMDTIKRTRIARLIEHYNSGAEDWNLDRAGGGSGPDTGGLTVAGIMRALGCDNAAAERKVTAFMERHGLERKGALAKLALIPEIANAISAIRAERAGVQVSLSDLDD